MQDTMILMDLALLINYDPKAPVTLARPKRFDSMWSI